MLKKVVNAWTVVRCLVISFALLFGFASGYADGRNFAKRQFERDTQLRDGSNHYVVYGEPRTEACFRRDLRRIGTPFGQGEESVAFVFPSSEGKPARTVVDVPLVDGVVSGFSFPAPVAQVR